MGCKSLATCFLVSFNMVFLIFGGGCLGGGIYILVAKNEILVLARSATGSLDTSDLDLPSLIEWAAYVLIGAGSFVFIVSFLGCCGACLQNKKMLIAYAVIVVIILVIQITAVILAIVFNDQFDTYARDNLKSLQRDRYIGPYDTSDVVSLAFDVAQIYFTCCGVENGGDYASLNKWNTTYIYDNGGGSVTATAVIPVTCCEFSNHNAFPDDLTTFLNSMTSKTCPVDKSVSYYNTQVKKQIKLSFPLSEFGKPRFDWLMQRSSARDTLWEAFISPYDSGTTGCYDALKSRFTQYLNIIYGVGAGISALEITAIVCACCLMKKGKIGIKPDNGKNGY